MAEENIEINSEELRRFSAVWSPLVLAMPRAISVVERIEELTRHVAVLEQRRDAASADALRLKQQGEDDLAAARASLITLNQERQKAARDVVEHAKKCEANIKTAQVAADLEIKQHARRVAEAKAQADAEVAAIGQSVIDAKAAAAQAQAEIEAATAELEAKRESAQKALDKIKSKLE